MSDQMAVILQDNGKGKGGQFYGINGAAWRVKSVCLNSNAAGKLVTYITLARVNQSARYAPRYEVEDMVVEADRFAGWVADGMAEPRERDWGFAVAAVEIALGKQREDFFVGPVSYCPVTDRHWVVVDDGREYIVTPDGEAQPSAGRYD